MLLSWLIWKEGKQAPIRRLIGNRGMMQQIDEMYNATTIILSPLLSLWRCWSMMRFHLYAILLLLELNRRKWFITLHIDTMTAVCVYAFVNVYIVCIAVIYSNEQSDQCCFFAIAGLMDCSVMCDMGDHLMHTMCTPVMASKLVTYYSLLKRNLTFCAAWFQDVLRRRLLWAKSNGCCKPDIIPEHQGTCIIDTYAKLWETQSSHAAAHHSKVSNMCLNETTMRGVIVKSCCNIKLYAQTSYWLMYACYNDKVGLKRSEEKTTSSMHCRNRPKQICCRWAIDVCFCQAQLLMQHRHGIPNHFTARGTSTIPNMVRSLSADPNVHLWKRVIDHA